MQGTKTLKHHDELMDHMATTLGADLDEAEIRGVLPPEERSDMLLSCTNCTDPQGCEKWLKVNPAADAAPGFCRNGARLAEIAEELAQGLV